MHIAIWIFTLIGLFIWSLLTWGLHALLSGKLRLMRGL